MIDVLLIQLESTVFLSNSILNLGLISIASTLKSNGYSVKAIMTQNIIDMSFNERQTFFKEQNPKITGFNINSDNIFQAAYMAEEIKSLVPSSIIIAGGPLASIEQEKILEKYSCFDMAAVGEGEFLTLSLCRLLIGERQPINPKYFLETKQTSLDQIKGLIYRDGDKIRVVPRIPYIEPLDMLPPLDYTITDVPMSFRYSSGRGCPFRCAFCSQGVHAKGYRCFSPERVVNDITSNLRRLRAKAVCIVDDTFIARKERAEQICSMFAEERKNLDFVFCCEGRIDIFYKYPSLIKTLYDAGLRSVQMGIENGNQRILDLYNKKITLNQIETVIKNIYAHGNISMISNFIIGGPEETTETLENTLEFVLKLMRLAPGFFEAIWAFLCPYPGTEIAANPEKFGIKIIDNEWVKSLSIKTPSCVSKSLDKNTLSIKGIEFEKILNKEMIEITKGLSFEDINFHVDLFRYGIVTQYYSKIISETPSINSWYNLRLNNSKRLSEIQEKELKEFTPLRTAIKSQYRDYYLLKGWLEDIKIVSNEEKVAYDLSSGKLNIEEIAFEIAKKFQIDPSEALENVLIPFYKKLEKSFHIIFKK